MQGFLDLASQQQQRFWVYTGTTSGSFQTWIKPPGINFVHIVCVGAGGGGGGGTARRISTTTVAATGGGSGAMTSIFLPAYNVPDTLYILSGFGGEGGRGGESGSIIPGGPGASLGLGGTAGTPSYVCYYPNTSSGYVLNIANGGGAGLPGQTGNGSVVGGTAVASTAYPSSQFGLRTSNIGHGYLASAGASQTVAALYRVTAGGGGATIINTPNIGGSLGPAGELFQTVPGGTSQGAPGNNGYFDFQKFVGYGGTGGYNSVTQDGGLAGNGSYGSGGGAGAAGNLTGSNGGRGGDGFVIITCG
jgi:hypothetical protein